MNKHDPVRVITVGEAMTDMVHDIYEKTNGTVQAGPFRGMQLYPDSGWGERNIVSELLGFFEQELHAVIESQIARLEKMDAPVVVNVGCAEGYYTVGMGRRLPRAINYAFDIDTRSMVILQKNAEVNGVKLTDGSIEEAFAKADLIIMDVEGAEMEYLNPAIHPHLREAHIIVELHQRVDSEGDVVGTFYERFSPTHDMLAISEEGRNPHQSELLWMRHSFDRWLAVNESRPCRMAWGVLTPYVKPVRDCDGCTLCCKLERVEALNKPKGVLCQHCDAGCKIHDERPRICRKFQCLWTMDPGMSDWMRPDFIGAYAYGDPADGALKIAAEPEGFSNEVNYSDLIRYVTRERGLHALVGVGNKVEFVGAEGKPTPPAINLNWVLR